LTAVAEARQRRESQYHLPCYQHCQEHEKDHREEQQRCRELVDQRRQSDDSAGPSNAPLGADTTSEDFEDGFLFQIRVSVM
jgi:hypothetical protein